AVVLDDGTKLPAALAVVGIGITPATGPAVAEGLEVEAGVRTDSALRTSDPDIYAWREAANTPAPATSGRAIPEENWRPAPDGRPAAARFMLGQEVEYDQVPFFVTDQYGRGMEFSGWFEPGGYDRVVFRGGPALRDGEVPEYMAFWLDAESRVLAGMNVNIWDVADQIQQLVRAAKPVDPFRLADPGVPLTELLG